MRRLLITSSVVTLALGAFIVPVVSAGNSISPTVQKILNFSRLTDHHEFLGRLKGKWNGSGTLKATANGVAEKVRCKAEYKLILGKRFVEQKTTCKVAGQTVHGVGYFGYDLMNKSYVGTSMSSIDNGFSQLVGRKKGKVINFTITHNNTDIRKRVNSKATLEISGNGRHKYKIFSKDKNGKNSVLFEISYSR
ncbi:MAG: DUF1579 family protein [Rhizobiales bacterium]|nr:DUF1579 family protein [Hyphomicrobiales bacterium]